MSMAGSAEADGWSVDRLPDHIGGHAQQDDLGLDPVITSESDLLPRNGDLVDPGVIMNDAPARWSGLL